MTEASAGPKGKKSAKAGRNKAGCVAYKANNSAVIRKAKRIATHLHRYGYVDASARTALQVLAKAGGIVQYRKVEKTIEDVASSPSTPGYIRTMRYHAKRAAKAKRQLAKAIANNDQAAIMKADYYIERYSATA